MLLQKIQNDPSKAKSGNGLKIAFYLVSLGVAYSAGYYERPKAHPSQDVVQQSTISDANTPADEAAAVPLSTQAVATPSATPELINATAQSTPVHIEKAVAATPALITSTGNIPLTQSSIGKPVFSTPAAVPIKQANQVTITEPVEIPVKQAGKITGYINLQKGQLVIPVSVDNDEIKIKSGDGFVMIPIKSTDMTR